MYLAPPQTVLGGPGGFPGLANLSVLNSFGQKVWPDPPSLMQLPDCTKPPLKHNLVCNTSAPWLERAKAVVDLFTMDEIVDNLGNGALGAPRIGMPPYQWWGEALHGVAICPAVKFEDDHEGEWGHATGFPAPINLGATFDDDLVHEIATTISNEARAFANSRHSTLDFWTPNINPFRDPRWGRGQEVPGEDAFHISRYVYRLVTGLQGENAPEQYKVIASCKHYAGYDLDKWLHTDRFHFDAQISTQDLAEYHMLPFRSCVRDAKVGSVMCSYNSVNGKPTCANEYFLQDILRDAWGFGEGWVTGDCDAVLHIWLSHHYADYWDAAAVALRAGTDTDCGRITQATLKQAYRSGKVSEHHLKKALTRLYGSLIRAGYFDPPHTLPHKHLGWEHVNTKTTRDLAISSAEAGIVLLKNDGLLPITPTKYKKIALIGPMGNDSGALLANYQGVYPYIITPLKGLECAEAEGAKFEVGYAEGTEGIQEHGTNGFDKAHRLAKEADLIIFAGGINGDVEAEYFDRTSISYPGKQLDLILKLAKIGKPMIVLQFGGGQVDDTELKYNDGVNALLWAGYPGQESGTAIANILTGKTAPAGRLSVTQYPGNFTDIPMTHMELRPTQTTPGRTYKWYTGPTVYEFGHGLHYTTFELSWADSGSLLSTFEIPQLAAQRTAPHLDLENLHVFQLNVKNTGKVTSDYVALLFSRTSAGPQPAPLKTLIGYARAKAIAPGATVTVDLSVTLGAIARADEKGSFVLYPGSYDLWVDTMKLARRTFTLNGTATEILDFPQPR